MEDVSSDRLPSDGEESIEEGEISLSSSEEEDINDGEGGDFTDDDAGRGDDSTNGDDPTLSSDEELEDAFYQDIRDLGVFEADRLSLLYEEGLEEFLKTATRRELELVSSATCRVEVENACRHEEREREDFRARVKAVLDDRDVGPDLRKRILPVVTSRHADKRYERGADLEDFVRETLDECLVKWPELSGVGDMTGAELRRHACRWSREMARLCERELERRRKRDLGRRVSLSIVVPNKKEQPDLRQLISRPKEAKVEPAEIRRNVKSDRNANVSSPRDYSPRKRRRNESPRTARERTETSSEEDSEESEEEEEDFESELSRQLFERLCARADSRRQARAMLNLWTQVDRDAAALACAALAAGVKCYKDLEVLLMREMFLLTVNRDLGVDAHLAVTVTTEFLTEKLNLRPFD